MMKFRSIRFKSMVLYTAVLCIILLIFSSCLFLVIRYILYRDVDEELKIKANELASIFKIYEKVEGVEANPLDMLDGFFGKRRIDARERIIIDDLWRMEIQTLNLKNDYINILNADGKSVIISKNLDEHIKLLFHKQLPFSLRDIILKNITDKDRSYRIISMPVFYRNSYWFVIQIATPLDSVLGILHRLIFFTLGTIAVTLILTSFLGAFFASKILKPVRNVIKTADEISYEDLNLRIDGAEADDEMQLLVYSFNRMLERLEMSFQHISEFSSHVAHELKTPLAIMRGEMELALNETRDAEEYKRVITVALEEVNRLVRIIKDLLLLSKLDYQPDIFKFEHIDFDAFIEDIYQYIQILADEKGIETELNMNAKKISLNADKTHLRRLFFNLINNAVKFTPEHGKIIISTTERDGYVSVGISDSGPGISQENLGKIFNKFFRVFSQDNDSETGNGLGLSISQSIAKAHKGRIEVESIPGQGATFTVILPLI